MGTLLSLSARAADPYYIFYPAAWHGAVSNFAAFKSRLGYDVRLRTREDVQGASNTVTHTMLRDYLRLIRTNEVPLATNVFVMLVGNFNTFPAPTFQVDPSDSYRSDIYFQDLHTEFNRDGDTLFGEYSGASTTQDFDSATFTAVLNTLSNDLLVGRIPVNSNSTAAAVLPILEHIIAFERDTSLRKQSALFTAGRIDTNFFTSDSWDYVVQGLVTGLETTQTGKTLTAIAHVATNHMDRSGIDYVVEGGDLMADYLTGQSLVRGLINSNLPLSFLCTVSHGGSTSDFGLNRSGSGFPTNRPSLLMLSMSCASYSLGSAAVTGLLASTYLGSIAVVTPDVPAILAGANMVSGDTQQLAVQRLFVDNRTVGGTFREGFDYYRREIQTRSVLFYSLYRTEILRNLIGFQLIGDPTLVHARPDSDGDALLDDEEATLGTQSLQPDTDGDGLPDGYEFGRSTLNALVHNGADVDGDRVSNQDELIAGTDPENASSLPLLTLAAGSTEPLLEWSTTTGCTYSLEATPTSLPDSWTSLSNHAAGTGAPQNWSPSAPAQSAIYRLLITR